MITVAGVEDQRRQRHTDDCHDDHKRLTTAFAARSFRSLARHASCSLSTGKGR
jgi:hypothetical protein